jgi:alkaline phosphatase
MPRRSCKLGLALGALLSVGFVVSVDAAPAKNVVLMVADGAGFNSFKATAMYEGSMGRDFHDKAGWVRLAASTHSLRRHMPPSVSTQHARTQAPALLYDPLRAWDTTREPSSLAAFPYYFAGYKWLRQTASDSANTISALVTGQPTYVGSINFDGSLAPIKETLAYLAHERGKRVGVVSSVPISHATPAAAAGAHQAHRSSYCELAVEMLSAPYPDVLAGCGNPDFDNNGARLEDGQPKEYKYVGGKPVWDMLTGVAGLEVGELLCPRPTETGEQGIVVTKDLIAALQRWTMQQSTPQIESLLEGATPSKLLVVPPVGEAAFWGGMTLDPARPNNVRVGGTLQQQRGSRADPRYTSPGYDPPIADIPSLETLTRVALNALDDDKDGFFLHVEGGAVDWAMHENQLGRMVEEMIDFKRSIEAVVRWIESHGGWSQTLLIVTADHDHMLWGPNAESVPFDPLQDNGAGRLPSYRWLSKTHSNALVPVYARGAGSEQLPTRATSADPYYGPYLHQADIFEVLKTALAP